MTAEANSVTANVTEEDVADLVRRELLDFGVEEETIVPSAKFDDLDIDSLDAAELMTTIKKQYGVEMARPELADVTVQQLVDRIVSSIGS